MHFARAVPGAFALDAPGIATTFVFIPMAYLFRPVPGKIVPEYVLCCATAFASINTAPGAPIDQPCTRTLPPFFPGLEARANRLMLQQVKASRVHASTIRILPVAFEGIL